MKICHVTSQHDWNDDRIYQRACVGLASKGHEVLLIATHESKTDFVSEGVKIIPLKNRPKNFKRRVWSSLEAVRKIKKMNTDIIHFHDPDLLPFMLILSVFKKGIVYDIHENYVSRIYEKKNWPLFLRKILAKVFRGFETFCMNRFSGFTVTTVTMGNMFTGVNKAYCVTSNVPYLSILPKDLHLKDRNLYPSVYISGSHSRARNCVEIIQAIPKVVKEIPEVRFIFAGKYVPEKFREFMLELAEKEGVASNLMLEGNLKWLENFSRTATMHVGLVLYQDNQNNRVTIPNRLFEYMAAGCAVIGEYFPEVQKVISDSDCGWVVNSSNPEEIANAVIDAFSDMQRLKTYGKNARKAIEEKYNYENELDRLLTYYTDLTTNPKKLNPTQ